MALEVFNGIDAETGDYLRMPVETAELVREALEAKRHLKDERDLRWAHERDFRNRGPDRRPAADVDPMDLSSSGWGVIIPKGTPLEVITALRPLLDHRKAQVLGETGPPTEKTKNYYRELDYVPGESKDDFFRRHGVEKGPAHPEQLPYYLLIVGGPDVVPYRFQYLLDMQYAVGRIFFDDFEDYGRYAESVVAAEVGHYHVLPKACFFSVHQPEDLATEISDKQMVRPLVESLEAKVPEWEIQLVAGEQADKPTLGRLLGGGETPALLLTAAHGLVCGSSRHLRQRERQGAIICKEWPGHKRRVLEEHYFSAVDVSDEARVHGLIAFLFGCYSAGTPAEHNFPSTNAWGQPGDAPPAKPFMSGLARRLLSHPNGGALAVVGHVDRAWSCSFGSRQRKEEEAKEKEKETEKEREGKGIIHFKSFFLQLLEGFPVGLAMDWLNERFAEISTDLTNLLDEYNKRKEPLSTEDRDVEEKLLVDLWRFNKDARNFVILGDPAVRLANGPKIGDAQGVIERRTARGGLHVPVRKHWKEHVESWLCQIRSREPLDLGDPASAVQTLHEREKE